MVKIYDQDDEDMKKTLLDVKLPDASKLQSIVTARDDRKKKVDWNRGEGLRKKK